MPRGTRPRVARPSSRALAIAVAALGAPAAGSLVLAPAPVAAQAPAATQPGRIVGRVTDADGRGVGGAQVQVVGTRLGALTADDGRYRVAGVPAGTYELRVTRIGQRARLVSGVAVRAGAETAADVALEGTPVALSGVVVSASRRAEKITEAPATITAISTQQLDATVGNMFAGALKEAKGVDFIQTGMTTVAINARGFNSSFNNRFLMVEDGRIAVLPENGLPVGQFTATPKIDLAGMEVLVGPGSALYGPDAANGVLSLRTKDPRQFPGATVEVSGGTRSYRDVQARFARVLGVGEGQQLGFKVSGEYQSANDFTNYLTYTAGGALAAPTSAVRVREDSLKVPIDFHARVARGTAGVVYYRGDQRLELSGGVSRTDGVGQTNVGRNQLRDWGYNTLQLRYSTPHWYANVYRSQSTSGQSFALNRYAGAQLASSALSADSLRLLSDWPSDGRMYAGELQGNYAVPQLLNTAFVFGGQYRQDMVSSDRQWLTDRVTRRDVRNGVRGLYAQSTTPVSRFVDVVLAGRYDWPTAFDAQWSPKAGVVAKPMTDQAFRVTYNRAYKTPTILQTNFFIPDWTSIISIYGNTNGFTVTDAAGGNRVTYAPVRPESNRTWEYGYKGVFGGKLYLDATLFDSRYTDFLSPLAIIANPFATGGAARFASPTANPNGIPVNAQGRIVNQAGTPITPIVLTYYNLGRARVRGTDLGMNYYALPGLELRGTLSTVKLRSLDLPPGGSLEAAALNSPGTKWTLGASATRLGPVQAGLTYRNVNGYYFRSGINSGVIPTFGTVDVTLSYKVPTLQNALLNLSVNNLFGCTAQGVTFETPTGGQPNSRIKSENRACGFNRRHVEMINMPEIGTMAFLGLRLQR